jgi:hypothetical protein
MNWADWCLIGMGAQYLIIGGAYGWLGNHAMGLVMLCYGIANLGLVWTNLN